MTIPLAEQVRAAQRELAMRRSVYPRRVEAKRMTQAMADRETTAMEAIVQTLTRLWDEEEKA